MNPRAVPVESTELSVDEARALLLAEVSPVQDTDCVPLDAARGRVLATDLESPLDVPPVDNAAMDGYALRLAELLPDAPTILGVAGRALAGRPFDGIWPAGDAIRIMTGAALPAGADLVVAQEQVTTLAGTPVRIQVPPGQRAGQHCRRRGEDLARGSVALAAGRVLRAADLGLAASLGVATLTVRRRARVSILSTGDELLDAASSVATPLPGQIFDSNRVALIAAVERLGLEPIDAGIVPDSPEALAAALADACSRSDAILSSGGVSVGDADHTRAVMATLGTVRFASVAMRPGRPLAMGRLGSCLFIGLPGNPVAGLIAFHFIVRSALLRLAGAVEPPLPSFSVRAAERLKKRPGRTEYQRGRLVVGLDGRTAVKSTGPQGSGILRSMGEADVIIVLAAERGDVAMDEWVEVVPVHGLD